LHRGPNSIGRDSSNDFPIDDAAVSSHHCEVVVTESMIRVRDLGSCNGTFLDGQPISEAVLEDGQVLRLGTVVLLVVLPAPDIAIPELPPAEFITATTLADGRPACLYHPVVAATRRCSHCQHTFCETCVHRLRLMRKKHHYFCPECSGECFRLGELPHKPDSIARKVWKNLRFIFGRKRR
jgi:hypothetical protein